MASHLPPSHQRLSSVSIEPPAPRFSGANRRYFKFDFMALPYEARIKIYTFAGFVRPCPIPLMAAKGPRKMSRGLPGALPPAIYCLYKQRSHRFQNPISRLGELDCHCPNLPVQLLLVFKSIYTDLIPVFYGLNKFVIRGRNTLDLRVLSGLSPLALSSLSSLLIRFNCWPCPRGHSAPSMQNDKCLICKAKRYNADAPMHDLAEEVARQWQEFCLVLSQHIQPRQLQLVFICDTTSEDIAEQIVEPLHWLPELKDCTIRLGRSADVANHRLRTLAKRTCEQLTCGRSDDAVDEPPFPFEKLPKELRLYVLSFSQLARQGYACTGHTNLLIQDGRLINFNPNHSWKASRCCWRCSAFVECCCSRYAAFSKTCTCRVIPLELFLVSRQMYEDATEIFMSHNTFFFSQSPRLTHAFLQHFPTWKIRYLRTLHFKFGLEYFLNWEKGAKKPWEDIFEEIRLYTILPRLFLTIDLSETYDLCDEESVYRCYYQTYWEVARSLRVLNGALDMHIHLGRFRNLEPILERYVMGDDYDSSVGRMHPKAREPKYLGMASNRYELELQELPRWHKDDYFS